jgi:limonene-1,2-epoxide hydrolase
MSENEKLIRHFIEAWSRLDPDELADFFADQGIYHNIPAQAVIGKTNIRQFIAAFIKPWESTNWEIKAIACAENIVMVERLDKTVVAGQQINLPCLGCFEIADEKIKEWRDYFDMATYTGALSAALSKT